MNKNEIKDKIESIKTNSEYIRVSDNHPLELYVGKNEKGNPTLRFNGEFQPVKVIGNSILEIKQVKTSSYYSLMFSFTSKENCSLFYNFCEDIINNTSNYNGSDGYTEIVNRYTQWKKMFYGPTKLLSEKEVLGLIGELLFLEEYSFKRYGITVGINGWSGPEPTYKDFSYADDWYEIKTINSFNNSVIISSIEQLDSEHDGHLIVYLMEKMSPNFNGIKINSLVLDINNMILLDSDRDIFFDKLKQVGYTYNEIYDNYVYNYITNIKYAVKDDFPRLKRSFVPKGIGKIQYEVYLSHIEKYKEN